MKAARPGQTRSPAKIVILPLPRSPHPIRRPAPPCQHRIPPPPRRDPGSRMPPPDLLVVVRAFLRERADPHRPSWSSTSRRTSGCGRCECTVTRSTTSAPTTPTARRSCCARRSKAYTPKALIDRVWQEHKRDFDSFGISLRQLLFHRLRGEHRVLCGKKIYALAEGSGLRSTRARSSKPTTRSRKCSCRTASSRASARNAARRTSTATIAKSAARPTSRPSWSIRTRWCRAPTPIRKTSTHYFFRLSDPRCEDFLRAWVERGLASRRRPTRCANGSATPGDAKLADWDISPRRALFRLRNSRARRASISTCGWMRRSATSRASRICAETRGIDFATRGLDKEFDGHRAVSLHRQGHPVFPHAVLAGHARIFGHRTPTNVFAHGFLTVDGAKMSRVARHVHHRAKRDRHGAESGMAALLLRRQAEQHDGRHRPEPRRLPGAREQRPGRQVREYREPRARVS